MAHRSKNSFFHRHGLTVVVAAILIAWIVLYATGNEQTHLGNFFGNAIADWSGLLVMIVLTKYLFEKGAPDSRNPPHRLLRPIPEAIRDHSLTIVLVITGLGWVWLYMRMNPQAKWGSVVGNIVSEWTQIIGVLLLSKKLKEIHSKE